MKVDRVIEVSYAVALLFILLSLPSALLLPWTPIPLFVFGGLALLCGMVEISAVVLAILREDWK
jgi:hypothetical protein